jgi:tetratricopeptide (TPR) repeat protein
VAAGKSDNNDQKPEDLAKHYKAIPKEDQEKAAQFFTRGNTVAGTGNFEYAIEMYLQGLAIDPEATDAHQTLRDISLKRKASGGKPIGMFQAMKLKGGKEEKDALLNAEKLLAYDPGNTNHMVTLLQAALRGGFYDTVLWIGPILLRANKDSGKGETFDKYILLKNAYKMLERYKEATEAAQFAAAMRPDDMDLGKELKDLASWQTMAAGKYGSAKSFRESVRDMDKQHRLMEGDTDVRTADMMTRQIAEAEAEWQAEPNEPGKINKLVDLLVKLEQPETDQRAIELLESAYENTHQYRFKFRIGQIRINQLARQERNLRQAVAQNPGDESIKREYNDFAKERAEQELEIYKEAAENYPTESNLRFELAARMYQLGHYAEAIPLFQNVRSDPKHRINASIALGRSFLDAGYVEESVDTFRDLIEAYELKGDLKSVDMTYWFGRALEQKQDTQAALKAYSQVAQWNFNYRDVQARIKRLRSAPSPT